MNNTKIKSLTNIKIIEKQDKNLNDYYIIFNNDSKNISEAYRKWKLVNHIKDQDKEQLCDDCEEND